MEELLPTTEEENTLQQNQQKYDIFNTNFNTYTSNPNNTTNNNNNYSEEQKRKEKDDDIVKKALTQAVELSNTSSPQSLRNQLLELESRINHKTNTNHQNTTNTPTNNYNELSDLIRTGNSPESKNETKNESKTYTTDATDATNTTPNGKSNGATNGKSNSKSKKKVRRKTFAMVSSSMQSDSLSSDKVSQRKMSALNFSKQAEDLSRMLGSNLGNATKERNSVMSVISIQEDDNEEDEEEEDELSDNDYNTNSNVDGTRNTARSDELRVIDSVFVLPKEEKKNVGGRRSSFLTKVAMLKKDNVRQTTVTEAENQETF